jgi:hypothetical protein
MPNLTKKGYSFLKFSHVTFDALWIGGGLAMLELFLFRMGGNSYAVMTAIQIIDLGIVVPSALGSLITGVLFSWLTHWRFIKHRWIVFKYLINLLPVSLGAFVQAPWLVRMLEISKSYPLNALVDTEFHTLWVRFMAFTAIQWLLLLVAVYLSIFKPSLGRRKAVRSSSGLQPNDLKARTAAQ